MDRDLRRARRWAFGPLLALVWPCLQGCINLDSFLFAPTPAAAESDLFEAAQDIPQDLKVEIKNSIRAADGIEVSAWALRHDAHHEGDRTDARRHATAVLYCHGNNQNMARFALRAQALWALGYTVLAFDYRGYGKTRGIPTEEGTYLDGRAARAFVSDAVTGLGILPERVALYGYSLGAAVCSQLAVDAPAPALILEAPFASVAALVGDNSALDLPQAGFTQARYNTVGKIGQHRGALLIMHGEADGYVMMRYGREVSRAATGASPNIFVAVPQASHETVPCAVKNVVSPHVGGCVGGFDPAYGAWVSSLIDGAIAPDASGGADAS